ncbi:unnamed protein product, partial [Symbiodinium microadriaticum]
MLVTSSLHVRVTVINGRMDKSEQLEKVPCDPSELLLVIAISVAETSTTIDGLVVVFDSGLIGESRFVQYSDLEPVITCEDAIKANSLKDKVLTMEETGGSKEHFYLECNAALAVPGEGD